MSRPWSPCTDGPGKPCGRWTLRPRSRSESWTSGSPPVGTRINETRVYSLKTAFSLLTYQPEENLQLHAATATCVQKLATDTPTVFSVYLPLRYIRTHWLITHTSFFTKQTRRNTISLVSDQSRKTSCLASVLHNFWTKGNQTIWSKTAKSKA